MASPRTRKASASIPRIASSAVPRSVTSWNSMITPAFVRSTGKA
jgi:hypothetical protein